MSHFRIAKLVFGSSLLVTLAALPAAAQTELTGGAVTVSIPAGETTPAFTFTNKTGVPICDLVITSGAGAPKIKGAVVDDPQHTSEDWDVDDDANGAIDGTENSANPGSGAGDEGGGGGALGHADNTAPAAGDKVRVQEKGADADDESKCVGANRNGQVTVSLDAAAGDGTTLKIQPTNVRDANIVAFADGVLGLAEVWHLAADTTINSRFAAFGVDSGFVSALSFQVREPDVLLLELETVPKGVVDIAKGIVYFNPPIDARAGVRVFGILSEPGTLIVSGEGVRDAAEEEAPAEEDREEGVRP